MGAGFAGRWAVVRAIAVAALVGAALLALGGLLSSSSGAASPQPSPTKGDPASAASAVMPAGVKVTRELPKLRTETSRTYETSDGQRLTRFFLEPINYRNGAGDWKSIDTTLRRDPDSTITTKRGGVDLSIPTRLNEGSVRLAGGGDVAAFSLEDARPAAAELDGSTAHFDEALDGVDVDYLAGPDSVKETLSLTDSSAPAAYRFKLRLSAGLRPDKLKDGSIAIADGSGKARMNIPAPTVEDAKGASTDEIAYDIDRSGGAYELTVAVAKKWLDDPDRAYPVKVDPTLQAHAAPLRDCTITSSTPSTSDCSSTTMKAGTFGTSESRSLMAFDLSVIPKTAQIEQSWLDADVLANAGGAARNFGVYGLTKAFSTATTWSQAATGVPWTTAGGDIASTASAVKAGKTTTPYRDHWQSLDKLVQGWVDGSQPNYGLLLKGEGTAASGLTLGASESTNSAERPELAVFWGERSGLLRQYNAASQSLFDRSSASVNVANGNLVVQGNDLHLVGTGLDLSVGHTFNGRAYGYDGRMGPGWRLSAGGGVALRPMEDGNLMYVGPSGSREIFAKQPDGSFSPPTGIDAKLTASGTHYKLTFDQSAEVYEFDSSGDLVSDTDRNGNKITYTYATDATFSTIGKLSSIQDTRGQNTSVTYDGSGRVSKLTDPTGRTYQYGYNGSGQLSTYTDPAAKTTGYTYDGSGNLSQITDPRGKVTKMEYDTSGRVTELKRNYDSAAGTYTARWRFAYSAPDATCASTDIAKTVATDPRGNSTTYCFDTQLRASKVIDAKGRPQSSTYNANSDVLSHSNGSATTQRTYNAATNDPTGGTNPQGEQFSLGYNGPNPSPHQPTSVTNAQGRTTDYAYSTEGNLTGVTNGASPSQIQARLEYNGGPAGSCPDDPATKKGTLRCAVDGNGNQTRYSYDAQGRLTTINPPAGIGASTLTYDSAGRLKTIKDGKNQTTTYSYDALDRKTGVTLQDGSSITYGYDADGNRTSRTDSQNGSTAWSYDALNRRTGDTLPGSLTTTYGWDANSNLTSLADRSGTTSYGYDETNALSSLTEPEGGQTTFAYDTRDNRTKTTFPNGVVEDRTYDLSNKPLTIKAMKTGAAAPLTNFTYAYTDASARKTELIQSMTDKAGATTNYNYDGLDRLTDANTGSTTRQYTYDAASNRVRETVNGQATSYGFNSSNQMCWSVAGAQAASATPCASTPAGATTFSYDAVGNRTSSSNGAVFVYNARNQTTSIKPDSATGASTQTYQGEGQSELTGSGSLTMQNNLLGVDAIDGDTWGRYDVHREPNGALFSTTQAGVHNWLLQDTRGSVVSMANASGTSSGDWTYEPWGVSTVSGQTAQSFFKFAGSMRINGYSHFGQRYYAASSAQWSQADSVAQPQSLVSGNRYAYAADDPTNVTDPQGTCVLVSCKTWHRSLDTAADGVDRLSEGYTTAEGCVASLELGPAAPAGCGAVAAGDREAHHYLRKKVHFGCDSYLPHEEDDC